jgi:hypothetical protein
MTKEEMKQKIKALEFEIIELKRDYESLNEEFECAQSELENSSYYGIKDLDNFIWKLKLENLYTPELEKFIDFYLKFEE